MASVARSDRPLRAVALDLDGTLAGADHRVTRRGVAALTALEAHSIAPIILTGRTHGSARRLSREAGLRTPYISCTGAVIGDPVTDTRIREHHISAPLIDRVISTAALYGLRVILWTPEAMHAEQRDCYTDLLVAVNEEPVRVAPLETVRNAPVVKAMLAGPPALLDKIAPDLRRRLPELARSMDTFLESEIDGGKWGALNWVLDRLGIDPAVCAGVADGDTDAVWLSKIGMPVAVANARPSVKAVCVRTIGHHADDSTAAFLEELIGISGV